MDMTVIRSLVMVAAFVTFICIVAWAWSGSRRERFEAAARLPLEESEPESQACAEGSAGVPGVQGERT